MTDAYNTIDQAALYDLQQHYYGHRNKDIPFYLAEAKRWGEPVLELACGTGRITLPLARAGYNITALDLSPAMLSILQDKAASEALHLTLVEADMTAFQLVRTFRLIIIAYNSLLLLPTLELQRACLKRCRAHLHPEGALIVSIFPDYYWDQTLFTESDTFDHDWTQSWDEKEVIVSQTSRQKRISGTRCTHWEGKLEIIAPDGSIKIVEETLVLRWDTRAELEAILLETGLQPIEWYGSYDRLPVDGTMRRSAERTVAICRPNNPQEKP